jgi:S-adenosylmethionine:tRNA ribosyltransferase-isomerase
MVIKAMDKDLLLSSYMFDLPNHLIAARPVEGRHHSKLLVYKVKSGEIIHSNYKDIGKYLPENSTLIFNQSKVFPCRLIGKRASGGKCEVFLLSLIKKDSNYPALIKTSRKKSIGDKFIFGDLACELKAIDTDGSFLVEFNLDDQQLMDFLESHAKIPIPPYIRGGEADERDKTDYQTVYADELGSVAAPTAGLHFTKSLLAELESNEHQLSYVTLHVGAGTFLPVKTENIQEHKMHSEFYKIDNENRNKISSAKNRIAIGTTSLRVLESSYDKDFKTEDEGFDSTDIFLYPGREVRSINGLITNFHLPGSSLLMLVSSLIGREKTLELYKVAVENEYRFFSYGDGMLILRDE